MNEKNGLKNFLRQLHCYLLSYALLQPTFVLASDSSFIDNLERGQQVPLQSAGNSSNGIMGMMGSMTQMMQQQQMQQQQMQKQQMLAQQQQQMQQMMQQQQMQMQQAYNATRASFPATTPVPSKIFPQCMTSPFSGVDPRLAQMCSAQGPAGVGQAKAVAEYAQFQIGFLDQILDSNSSGAGENCLQQNAKAVVDQLGVAAKNEVTVLENGLKQQIDAIKNQMQNKLNEMATLNAVLYGGGGDNLAVDSLNYMAQMKSCQNILPNDKFGNQVLRGSGLLRFRDFFQQDYAQVAGKYQSTDRAMYETQLDAQVKRIQDSIQQLSVSGAINSIQGKVYQQAGETNFKGLENATQNALKNYQVKFGDLRNQIVTNMGGEDKVPAYLMDTIMNPNAKGVDKQNSLSSLEGKLRNDFFRRCVIGNEFGYAPTINIDEAISDYYAGEPTGNRALIKSSLESKKNLPTVESFLASLAPGNTLGNFTFKYRDTISGQVMTTNFKDFYTRLYQECEKDYNFSGGNGSTASRGENYRRAAEAAKGMVNLDNEFQTDFTNQLNQIKSCGNIAYNSQTCVGSGGHFDPGSDSFCLQHANTCAEGIQRCLADTQATVTNFENKIKTQATAYNQSVEQFYVKANNILKNIAATALARTQAIAQKYPGVALELPSELSIKLPEMTLSGENKMYLRGGGNLDFDQEFLSAVEGIKEKLGEQADKIAQHLEEQIGREMQALSTLRGKFEELKSNCEGNAENQQQMLADNQQKMMEGLGQAQKSAQDDAKKVQEEVVKSQKKQKDDQKALLNACRLHDSIARSKTAPGCDKVEKLLDSLSDIDETDSTYGQIASSAYEMERYCIESQSEVKTTNSLEGYNNDENFMGNACRNNSDNNAKQVLLQHFMDNRPSYVDKGAVERFLNEPDDAKLEQLAKSFADIPGGATNSNYYSGLKNYLEVLRPNKKLLKNEIKDKDILGKINSSLGLDFNEQTEKSLCLNYRYKLVKSLLGDSSVLDTTKTPQVLNTAKLEELYEDKQKKLDKADAKFQDLNASIHSIRKDFKTNNGKDNRYAKIGEKKFEEIGCTAINEDPNGQYNEGPTRDVASDPNLLIQGR